MLSLKRRRGKKKEKKGTSAGFLTYAGWDQDRPFGVPGSRVDGFVRDDEVMEGGARGEREGGDGVVFYAGGVVGRRRGHFRFISLGF